MHDRQGKVAREATRLPTCATFIAVHAKGYSVGMGGVVGRQDGAEARAGLPDRAPRERARWRWRFFPRPVSGFPILHTMLNTGIALGIVVVSLLFWDLGWRTGEVAACATWPSSSPWRGVLEVLHVLAALEPSSASERVNEIMRRIALRHLGVPQPIYCRWASLPHSWLRSRPVPRRSPLRVATLAAALACSRCSRCCRAIPSPDGSASRARR